MSRKRGRPRGKKFPEPRTAAEAFDIAAYGKMGGSEAIAVLRDCPYRTIDFIQTRDPQNRDRVDQRLLELAPVLTESWLRRIEPILREKIIAGDGGFFSDIR